VDMHSRVKEVQTQDYGVRIAIDRAGFADKSRPLYLSVCSWTAAGLHHGATSTAEVKDH